MTVAAAAAAGSGGVTGSRLSAISPCREPKIAAAGGGVRGDLLGHCPAGTEPPPCGPGVLRKERRGMDGAGRRDGFSVLNDTLPTG